MASTTIFTTIDVTFDWGPHIYNAIIGLLNASNHLVHYWIMFGRMADQQHFGRRKKLLWDVHLWLWRLLKFNWHLGICWLSFIASYIDQTTCGIHQIACISKNRFLVFFLYCFMQPLDQESHRDIFSVTEVSGSRKKSRPQV